MGLIYLNDYRELDQFNDGVGEGYNLAYESDLWWLTYKKNKIKQEKEKDEVKQLEREHIKAWIKLLSENIS